MKFFLDRSPTYSFFFFNDTATTEIYTLSLHDALPIFGTGEIGQYNSSNMWLDNWNKQANYGAAVFDYKYLDRKSTRLNSSHRQISYAVFCLKKKKNTATTTACES